MRFGASAEGGIEGCLNLCNGDLTLEGTYSISAYVHFGTQRFNRSYEWGVAGSGELGRINVPRMAVLSDYCNRQPDPSSCCCKKKYGNVTP